MMTQQIQADRSDAPEHRRPTGAGPRRILVATDASGPAEAAVGLATDLAGRLGCDLGLVYVVPAPLDEASSSAATGHRVAETFLGHVPATAAPGHGRDRLIREGNPAGEIVAAARDWRADLVVFGTHGRRGLARMILGSVAAGVVRTSPVPVLCVSHEPAGPVGRRVLVALDQGGLAQAALDWAGVMAGPLGTQELLLLHVVPCPGPMGTGYGLLTEDVGATLWLSGDMFLDARHPDVPAAVNVHRTVRQGQVPSEILDVAATWGADLIVMGAFGKRGLERTILGSTADAVLRRAPCPVVCLSHDPAVAG